MLHIISFQIFFIFTFFVGRGLISVVKNYSRKSFSDNYIFLYTPIYLLYPVFGLFFIGNINLLINFFSGVNNIFVYSTIGAFVLFFNIRNKLSILKNKLINLNNFIITPGIIAISSLGIGFARDAGGYHLNVQNWIRESKIVFGLYNLNPQYGFSSIIDYINSPFWINDSMILQHYVNLTFVSVFLSFLFFHIKEKENGYLMTSSVLILALGFLDNFGFNGGKNGFIEIDSVPKQDTAFAIVFYLASVSIFIAIKHSKFENIELILISLLVLFTYQLRILGFTIFILFGFYLFLWYKKANSVLLVAKNLSLFFILNFFWFLKNTLLTGCVIFPLNISCFSILNWYNKDLVLNERLSLANDWHKAYDVGDNVLTWFTLWSENVINRTVAINFISSFLILLFICVLFGTRNDIQKSKITYVYFLFILMTFLIWLFTAPGIRLGIILFLLIINFISVLLTINTDKGLGKLLNYKVLSISFYLVVVLLLPRLANFNMLKDNFLNFNQLNIEKVSYVSANDEEIYGVKPENKIACWVNLMCSAYNMQPVKVDGNFYSYFTVKK